MSASSAFDEASVVHVVDGEVVVNGPAGIAFALTPEAALETGRRLVEAASEAIKQRRQSGR